MSVLCTLGLHRPSAFPRWNNGYYFSTCRRCGQDLIRTAYEGWHVPPRGSRVVWSATPPKGVQTADLAEAEDQTAPKMAPETAETSALAAPVEATPPKFYSPPAVSEIAIPQREDVSSPESGDLPITEVLVLLREQELRRGPEVWVDEPEEPEEAEEAEKAPLEEFADTPAEEPPEESAVEEQSSQAEAAPVEEVPPIDPAADFMAGSEEEADDADFWAEGRGEEVAEPADESPEPSEPEELVEEEEPAAAVVELPVYADEDLEEEPAALVAEAGEAQAEAPEAATASAPARRDKAAWPSAAPTQVQTRIVGMNEPASDSRRALRIAAGVVIAAAILALATRGKGSETALSLNAVAIDEAVAAPSESAQVFVSEDLANCRVTPVSQAAPLLLLSRGEAVRVIARQPGWFSVNFEGRQCWVDERALSAERPL